jgi:hypothetical protein
MIAAPGVALHALSADWAERQNWPAASHTFHGRDIFAPLAAALFTGQASPAAIGPEARHPSPAAVPSAVRHMDSVTGSVAAVDTWGNLITNIDEALLAGLPAPRVSIGHRELPLTTTYGSAPPGALLALINSFGTVEIAWREGNAAEMLQLGHGAPVSVVGSTPPPL